MSTNLKDLFNPGSIVSATTSFNSDEYGVSYKEGKGGIYTSVIRFIPYVANPSKSLITKYVSYVKNPITNQAIYVDDPRSIGQKSPILDMFFNCWGTNNAQIRDFAKQHISTKQQYVSLIQIIQDEQHPELVGKIMVFKFGKKIFDKLEAEQKGIMGNGINPFHPITGRYFLIKCISQSGFNNFDQSMFFDPKGADGRPVPSGFWYLPDPSKPKAFAPVTEESDQQAVADFLKANSPDLSTYDYTQWSAQDDKFINETLVIVANYLEKGTLQSNLQTVNTTAPAGLQTNPNPVFPGAQPQPAPAPIPTPATPQAMPQAAPASPINISGLQFGSPSLNETVPMSQPEITAPSISGIEIPNVGSVEDIPAAPGIGGNLDDIISQL